MSNLLACILVCISVRDKHDEGTKKMCSTGISFGRSKLLQSCSNFTLKPGRTKTNCNSLFSLQRCSGGFVYWICPLHRAAIQSDCDSYQTSAMPIFKRPPFPQTHNTVLNGVFNGLQRESWSFGKNYPLSVLTIVYNSPLLLLFTSQAGQCSVLCDHHGAR